MLPCPMNLQASSSLAGSRINGAYGVTLNPKPQTLNLKP